MTDDIATHPNHDKWWPPELVAWITDSDDPVVQALNKGLRSFGWPDYNVPHPLPYEDTWPGIALSLAAALARAEARQQTSAKALEQAESERRAWKQNADTTAAHARRLVEALLYARDCISSPTRPYTQGPLIQDIYDTPMMGRALRKIDAVLDSRGTGERDKERDRRLTDELYGGHAHTPLGGTGDAS